MENGYEEVMKNLLIGAVDMHCHSGPSIFPRSRDMMEVMLEAREVGMKAVVFKCAYSPTYDRAYFVNKVVRGVFAFGGIVLDRATGGLNPYAVESAIKLGAKVIWMPSLDSSQTYRVNKKDPKKGLSILEGGLEGDKLLPVMKEIFKLIAQSDVILDTGHLSPKESLLLIDEAKKYGVKKILINHPNGISVRASIDEQKEMARKGAYLNYVFYECMPTWSREDPAEIANYIKAVGPEHCMMSSDFGAAITLPSVEGMKLFVLAMLANGITEDEIEIMIKKNPYKFLDIF